MKKRNLIVWVFIFISMTSCKVSRFVVYNFADIDDYKKFPDREIQNTSEEKFQFAVADTMLQLKIKDAPAEEFFEKYKTVAFLVIQNDTIQYEKYLNKYEKESIVTSFSVAKSVISMLIGIAIEEGHISSVHDPVSQYISELKENGFDKVTIEDLLQMTSGLKFNESYFNPFGHAATYYYGRNLEKVSTRLKLAYEPQSRQDYTSGSTQLLGLVLQRALPNQTISSYLEEKIWTPLQMEYPASWSLDKKDGMEKAFCCLNARARDFAKLGRLYLNEGEWNGTQIVPKEWVRQSTKVDSTNGSKKGYQYQWWLPNEEGDFMAVGILGQYIFVSPEKNLIIVRNGKSSDGVNWKSIFLGIKLNL